VGPGQEYRFAMSEGDEVNEDATPAAGVGVFIDVLRQVADRSKQFGAAAAATLRQIEETSKHPEASSAPLGPTSDVLEKILAAIERIEADVAEIKTQLNAGAGDSEG
jgi:DNA-binding ferritin-like protein